MGGEPALTTVRFPKHQQLPDGYRVVFDGVLYWWDRRDAAQRLTGEYGGGSVDRWEVRRAAMRYAQGYRE